MYQSTEGQCNAETGLADEMEATAKRQASPWLFFAATLILSWLFWVPAAVLSQRGSSPPDLLLLLGGFGPSIVGVAMVYWTEDSDGRLDFLRRALSLRRIGPAWYAFILLHFAYNFTFSFLYPIPETVHLYGTILTLVLAVAIVAVWGPRTLARRRSSRRGERAVA